MNSSISHKISKFAIDGKYGVSNGCKLHGVYDWYRSSYMEFSVASVKFQTVNHVFFEVDISKKYKGEYMQIYELIVVNQM